MEWLGGVKSTLRGPFTRCPGECPGGMLYGSLGLAHMVNKLTWGNSAPLESRARTEGSSTSRTNSALSQQHSEQLTLCHRTCFSAVACTNDKSVFIGLQQQHCTVVSALRPLSLHEPALCGC